MTYTLGRLVEHDPASRGYPAARSATPLKTVLWAHRGPVLDQGSLGSCTGNALADCLNTDYFTAVRIKVHKARFLKERDAVTLYEKATVLDGFPGTYPPDDTGSSGLGVCKAGKALGYLRAYHHAFGFNHFAAALQVQPVIIGSTWHDDMFTPDAKGFVTPTGNAGGGHEYLALGLDLGTNSVEFLNSWGRSFGLGGRFSMTIPDFTTLLADQGDVTAPIGVA